MTNFIYFNNFVWFVTMNINYVWFVIVTWLIKLFVTNCDQIFIRGHKLWLPDFFGGGAEGKRYIKFENITWNLCN